MSITLTTAEAELASTLLADVVAKVEAGDMFGACTLLRSPQPPVEGDSAGHAVLASMNIVAAAWTLCAAALIEENFTPREAAAVEATITQAGSYAMSQAEITIYNAPLSIANAVASYGQPLYYMNRNTVALLAGDDQAGMSLVFEGNITEAAVDFTQAPNLAFNVTAATGIDAAMTPVVPSSYKGRVDVANIISQIAATMGFAFENDGVSCIISNPYLQGTALNQLQLIARAANINYFLDRGTLAIWPKNVARGSAQGKQPVPVGPDTGLYGYPTYTTFGCMFRTLYNPMLNYGSAVKVTSSLPPAQGEWIVYNLAHVLSAQVREGDWFSDVLVARAGGVPAVT